LRKRTDLMKAVVLMLEALIRGAVYGSYVKIIDPDFGSLSSGNGRDRGDIDETLWARAA
jgi:hypothetical protein